MKISTCHGAKMIKHSHSWLALCPVCGYASWIVDTTWKKYKKSTMRWVTIYSLIEKKNV